MTREDIVALFEKRQQAMNRHDVATLSDMFSEDAVVESPTAGGTIRGRRRNDEVWHAVFNGFPDVVFSAEDLVIDGNRAVWITETHGTDTGGFLGLPPTGKPFRLPVVWVCTLDGGQIVHERRIYDFTGMLMQIGVLKANRRRKFCPSASVPGTEAPTRGFWNEVCEVVRPAGLEQRRGHRLQPSATE